MSYPFQEGIRKTNLFLKDIMVLENTLRHPFQDRILLDIIILKQSIQKIDWWAGRWEAGQSGWHSAAPQVRKSIFNLSILNFATNRPSATAGCSSSNLEWRFRDSVQSSCSPLWQGRLSQPPSQCRPWCCWWAFWLQRVPSLPLQASRGSRV